MKERETEPDNLKAVNKCLNEDLDTESEEKENLLLQRKHYELQNGCIFVWWEGCIFKLLEKVNS